MYDPVGSLGGGGGVDNPVGVHVGVGMTQWVHLGGTCAPVSAPQRYVSQLGCAMG